MVCQECFLSPAPWWGLGACKGCVWDRTRTLWFLGGPSRRNYCFMEWTICWGSRGVCECCQGMVREDTTKAHSVQVWEQASPLINFPHASYTEWHLLCVSGSSKTFKVNSIGHVVFVPLFSQHMRAKTTTSRLACKPSKDALILLADCGLVQPDSSNDVSSVLQDGKDFRTFCTDWKSAALWEQWTQFGKKCFAKGLASFLSNDWISFM